MGTLVPLVPQLLPDAWSPAVEQAACTSRCSCRGVPQNVQHTPHPGHCWESLCSSLAKPGTPASPSSLTKLLLQTTYNRPLDTGGSQTRGGPLRHDRPWDMEGPGCGKPEGCGKETLPWGPGPATQEVRQMQVWWPVPATQAVHLGAGSVPTP